MILNWWNLKEQLRLLLSKWWIILSPGEKGSHIVNNNTVSYSFGNHRFMIIFIYLMVLCGDENWNVSIPDEGQDRFESGSNIQVTHTIQPIDHWDVRRTPMICMCRPNKIPPRFICILPPTTYHRNKWHRYHNLVIGF